MKKYVGFSTRLLILNGLAIFAVPLAHAADWAFVSMSWTAGNFDQMSPLTYYTLRAIQQVVTFAIPAFLFVSGYFISVAVGRTNANNQWKVIYTRVKFLVIPFLFWSVLILVLDIVLGNSSYSVWDFLLTIITGKARVPYYFVPLLVQLLILAPFLVLLARTNYKLLLVLTAIIQLIARGLRYDTLLGLNIPVLQPLLFLTNPELFPSRIFSFSFGIVFGLHFSQFKQTLMRVKWGLLVSLVVFFILGIMEWEFLQRFSREFFIGQTETVIDVFYAFAFVLCYFAFEEFIPPFSKQLEVIGGASLGIYLTHWSVQEYMSKFIIHFAPWLIGYQILMLPILVVCGLGLPMILMTLVKRSPIKHYYRYLFG
jgi:probable poly-beta-1,6-N-acetyl-D-glucosamine export protein